MRRLKKVFIPFLLAVTACEPGKPSQSLPVPTLSPSSSNLGHDGDAALRKLDHLLVIYPENLSFANLYGEFAGADGLSSPSASAYPQVDATNTAYATLPNIPSSFFPTGLANAPFNIEQYLPANVPTIDLVHRFYQEQVQID